MSEIVVVCPFCHRTVRVPIRIRSRRVRCPECSERGYVADPYHLPFERGSGPLLGESILNCVIERQQAQDTFNLFYRAFDEEAEVPVLLRVPRPEWARQPRHLGEALRVELLAAGIEHPHLLAATRAGEDLRRGIRYAILPMHPLVTLHEHVQTHGPLSPRRMAILGSLLADALAELHDLGVVHQAVSPTNVVVSEEGAPALKGFEFARFFPGDAGDPLLMRSPDGLAPEQVAGGAVDERTDIYLLGLTVRAAAGGRPPRWAVAPILERMLSPDPAHRYSSCREVRAAFDELLGLSAPSHLRERHRPRRSRRRATVTWSVPEFLVLQQRIREVLDRPKDDWRVEDWRRDEPSSREMFLPATYHRDNQIALVFLKHYHHSPEACEEHLARYTWIGAFFAAHGEDLERRGHVVADPRADTFGVRAAIIEWLCTTAVEEGQAQEASERNAVLRVAERAAAGEGAGGNAGWVAVDSACFPQIKRRPDPWDPDY